MKKGILTILLILISNLILIAGEQPRKPFIELKVNGQTYQNGAEITVRPGEKIKIEAILMGGQRDYCSNPQKYANVGKNTVIESSGENRMSFNINGGQFRGKWTLTSENANFSSTDALKISTLGDGIINREAFVEIPKDGFSKIYIKVVSKTKWHYVRNTPAGKSEKDEENEATATFYFKLETEEGVWYSSNNLIAKGLEDFTVRNELDEVQKFYNLIDKALQKNDLSNADMQIQNLKNYVAEIKRAIDDAKAKNADYKCDITFIGLPTDIAMSNLNKLKTLSDKWKERYMISQGNADKINEMLLNYQMGFSANILRSVFKNYISWGTSIPTGAEDLLSIYDPNNIFGNIDIPRKLIGWYTDAQNDAGILKNQAQTIKNLSELREFYLKNMSNFVSERKKLQEIIIDLKPIEERNNALKQYFSSISWAKWQAKNM
ncbi:MAG: hypothetical protein JXR51_03100 [Bacteroidales bacterium]|nr:hypothetical protein [Bacteroidales bacterium]MBN2756138.1 hypothetical protein [Bacteroidales bacterium]